MRYTVKSRASDEIIASGHFGHDVRDFEGNWYFTPETVNMRHLKVTDRIYTCPYKGVCYWIDLETKDGTVTNVAWVYRNPKPGYEFIKDQIGFYARNTQALLAVTEVEEAQAV